jgi:hypothetical protein
VSEIDKFTTVVYLVALQNDSFKTHSVHLDSRKVRSTPCLLETDCKEYRSAKNKTSVIQQYWRLTLQEGTEMCILSVRRYMC